MENSKRQKVYQELVGEQTRVQLEIQLKSIDDLVQATNERISAMTLDLEVMRQNIAKAVAVLKIELEASMRQ